ncbi:hypothetical protein LOTGIDRAFT_152916 [Lottia gigantea]|uniref:RING-type domain-containing protein n=1 Tax=Lottia gigantea TaxID=225164 RepID=V4A1V8_LOTGI|nr:hypothetical protein LOTGIDRAFT_152916 [Lottia gigantea]ESO97813.1 hypothetical protein LOTGIDRAFT_152916 [Lottia gigantea]
MEPPLYVLAELSPMEELNAPLNRSARLRYTCMSVSKKYIALGSNTGGAYIFTRDTLKYLQVIFGEVESSSVGVVSLSQATDNHVAFTTSSGQVIVMEMNLEKRLKPERVRLSNDHAGYTVTTLQWNKTGNKLFIGDNSGKVTVAHVPLTKASVLFNQPTEMIARLESAIVQIDYNHEKLLVSTLTRCYLFSTQSENIERSITARFIKTRHQYSQIGKKLRDGEFGACFFVEPSSNIPVVYCSRPGSRMWEVDFEGNVLNTHQFKKLLSISSTPIVHFNKSSLLTEYSSTTVISPSVNFKKMYTIGQYIITWCTTGLYVFDTINVKVILWSYDIQDIEDLCVYENSVFIFHNDQSIEHLYLFKLEQCINHLITKKCWLLAANTLFHFKQHYLSYLRSKISPQTVKNVILNIKREEHRDLINSLTELIIVQLSSPTSDPEGQDKLNHIYPNHSDTNSVASFDLTYTSDSGSEVVSPQVFCGVHESNKMKNNLKSDEDTHKNVGVASEASNLNHSDLSSDNHADISLVSTDLDCDSIYDDSELSKISIEADDSSAEDATKKEFKTFTTKLIDFSHEDGFNGSNETAEDFSIDAHSTPKEVEPHEVDYGKKHSDQSLLNSSQDFSNDSNNVSFLSNNSGIENTSHVEKEHFIVEKSSSAMFAFQNERENSREKPIQIWSSAENHQDSETVKPDQPVSNESEKNNSTGNSVQSSTMNEEEEQTNYKDTPVAVIPEVDDDIIVKKKSKNSSRRRKVNEIDLLNGPGLNRSPSVKSKTKKRELKTKRSVSVPALDNSLIIKRKDIEQEHDTVSLCSMEDIHRFSTPDTLPENQQQFKDSDTISLNSLEENSSETVLPLIKRLSLSGITTSLDEQQRETSSSVDSLNTIDSPSGSLSQSPRVTLMAVKDSLAMKLKKGKTFIKTMKEKSQLSKSPTVPDNSFADTLTEEHQIVMSTLNEQIVRAKDETGKPTEVPIFLPKTDIRNLISATEEAQNKLQDIQVMLDPSLLAQTLNEWVTVLNTTFRTLQKETNAKTASSNDNTKTSDNVDEDTTSPLEVNVPCASSNASSASSDSSQDTKWCNTFDPFGLDVDLFPQVSELTKLCFQTCCHGNVSAYINPKITLCCDKGKSDTDALYSAQNKCNDCDKDPDQCDNHKICDENNCDNPRSLGDQNRCECQSESCLSTNSVNVDFQPENETLPDTHQTTNDASDMMHDIQNHSEAPDKGHELQMTTNSNTETQGHPVPNSLNYLYMDTNCIIECDDLEMRSHELASTSRVQDPRQQLDQELSVFVRCYFAFLGTNVIRQFLNEQKDVLFKTWLTLIECCQELGKEDPIKMYINQHDVNDALDHLRSGIIKYKDAFLGHYASIFGMSVYKCIEFGKDVPDKVSPLDILNLCHHYNKPTHQYLLKYIMMRYNEAPEYNRLKTLHSICEHPEVKLELLKCLLTRKDGFKYDKPSPGSHLVKWTHHKMINDVLNMIDNKQEQNKAEMICEEYGYWLGYLRLIDTDIRWRDVMHLICCLGDIDLLCTNNDFSYTPKSTGEWKCLLQEVLSLESDNVSKTCLVPAIPDFIPSLTLENTALLLVDYLGPHVAANMLQELSLEDDRSLSNDFYQKCICKAITQAQQGVVIHNMLEKLNTYLWSKKPQNMAPQIHYAVNGEISSVRILTDSTISSSYQTDFSRLSAPGRVIQLGLEDAECHWGIQAQINSEYSNCNLYISVNVVIVICISVNELIVFGIFHHMEPGTLIFQCGHAFHKYCVSRQECPLC